MNFSTAALFIGLSAVAGSYGWGMRGCKIGGEKGALLPGAFLGLLFAWFAPAETIRDHFWLITAAGALGMAFGGTETYGQTLGFVVSKKPPENYAKGMTGVLVKGALWFGIFGSVVGIALGAAAGERYRAGDIIVLLALFIPVKLLGTLIFNKPLDPSKNRYPKIYFSAGRQEEWGGLLLMLVSLVVLMAYRGDAFALWLCLAGVLSGSAGWFIGLSLFALANHPLNSGRYFYGPLQKKGYISGWKIMEFTLGAAGGLGISVCYVLKYELLRANLAPLKLGGALWNPLGGLSRPLSWAAFALFFVPMLQHLFYYLEKHRKGDQKRYHAAGAAFEWLEMPFLLCFPLALVLLGSVETARLVSFFLLFWVIVEMDFFERAAFEKSRWLWFVPLMGLAAAALACWALVPGSFTAWQTWLMYCVAYEFFELCWLVHESAKRNKAEHRPVYMLQMRRLSEPLVHLWFLLQIAALIIVGFFVLR
ncbi:MAG TPA: hypothetical protein PL044_10525 [Clostridiales bacterium]|nr:MAG: hypothetical protein BWY37_01234 [Firmicutes bacterium ADurb.Bin262]HOU10018.1 hypothetical protein [Clostridiales bacterium]HQK74187.1 hypothetical protein [Clostridiales bacterium]